jgi:hypothetical protein
MGAIFDDGTTSKPSYQIYQTVKSRVGAVAKGSVSHPRSSNRTCGTTASGFPTGFTSRHTTDAKLNFGCLAIAPYAALPSP